jgi:phage-related tail protein
LLFQFNSYGQIDPKKVDSLSRLIDSSAHAYKLQQDSVVKYQDSTNKSEVNKVLQQSSANQESDSIKQKRSEQEKRQETFVRSIALGVLVFVIVIIALMRRRRTKR